MGMRVPWEMGVDGSSKLLAEKNDAWQRSQPKQGRRCLHPSAYPTTTTLCTRVAFAWALREQISIVTIMASALEGCVASLRGSMQNLDSTINILDDGVSDMPRLAKVLQTTRVWTHSDNRDNHTRMCSPRPAFRTHFRNRTPNRAIRTALRNSS